MYFTQIKINLLILINMYIFFSGSQLSWWPQKMTTDISIVRWDPTLQQEIVEDYEYDGGNSSSRLFERSRIKALAGLWRIKQINICAWLLLLLILVLYMHPIPSLSTSFYQYFLFWFIGHLLMHCSLFSSSCKHGEWFWN